MIICVMCSFIRLNTLSSSLFRTNFDDRVKCRGMILNRFLQYYSTSILCAKILQLLTCTLVAVRIWKWNGLCKLKLRRDPQYLIAEILFPDKELLNLLSVSFLKTFVFIICF